MGVEVEVEAGFIFLISVFWEGKIVFGLQICILVGLG